MIRILRTVAGAALVFLASAAAQADPAISFSDDGHGDIARSAGPRLYYTVNTETDGPTLHLSVQSGYMFQEGAWSFGPTAGLTLSRGTVDGYTETGANLRNLTVFGRRDEWLVGSLGFRGAAKVDSRFGPIFSRLSLTFEHEFRANEHLIVAGLSGGGENGYYANRSDVDVMRLDAAFAMRMSEAVTAFVDYGAEIDLGSAAEHDVMLRLKFDF